jgi:hypothetical protein
MFRCPRNRVNFRMVRSLSLTLANFRHSEVAILQAFTTWPEFYCGLGSVRDPRENAENSHIPAYSLDSPVSKLAKVQLSGSCGFGGTMFKFDRLVVKSGGTVEPFTIPPQKVLVVTSLDWWASGGVGFSNRSRTAWVFRFNGGVNGPSAQSTALADSNGRAGGSAVFPTGIVLQNPGILCLQMDAQASGEPIIGVVNGFLAPDK